MKTEEPTGSRGVAYLRVSGDKQQTDSQQQNIQRWLTARGLAVRIWYEDVGSRHEAYKRREFQLMLEAVRKGEIDWIVVDSKDRFGTRDSYEFGKFATELRDHDVELWSVAAGHITADDYATQILTTVDSLRSKDEQLERSRRAIRGMIHAVESGKTSGGYPPHGFDVGCFGPDDKERWRVAYEGHKKRVKVLPDGSRERYDGANNFPARDQNEHLELVVSNDPKRIEAVRAVFKWYATESITLGAIAKRLNELGYDPIYGQAWYTNRITRMLNNPAVLVGKTVANKMSHGEFIEWRDGAQAPAPVKGGRALPYRIHDASDHIYPKEWGEGIVDRDTWDAVQAKLKGVHKSKRSARSPELWLGQFLYCKRCGTRMTGWTQKNHKADPYSYVCSSFRRYGEANKHGCRLHRIKHTEMVPIVEQWLDDTNTKLEEVLNSPSTVEAELEREYKLDKSQVEFARLMGTIWRTVKKWEVQSPPGGWAAKSLADAFREHAPKHQAKERAELKQLQAKYAEATESYLELPTRARELVRAKLETMETEIAALEERLRPMDEQLTQVREELLAAHERIRNAQQACEGANQRQRAQALSKVLARIVCDFEHFQTVPKKRQTVGQKKKGDGQDRSRLRKAVFEPLVGEPVELDVRNQTAGNRKL